MPPASVSLVSHIPIVLHECRTHYDPQHPFSQGHLDAFLRFAEGLERLWQDCPAPVDAHESFGAWLATEVVADLLPAVKESAGLASAKMLEKSLDESLDKKLVNIPGVKTTSITAAGVRRQYNYRVRRPQAPGSAVLHKGVVLAGRICTMLCAKGDVAKMVRGS